LNTYLFSKPDFTSPQPLAASSGLTIPLQITLSDFKLSAFIILVFSRQKGLTLVFRNDPLESLKVSSTFDSIPFVRDYLQKEIEQQLRSLMMDELPTIIHRLSLRLWCPDHAVRDDITGQAGTSDEIAVDPLSSPPQDAVDARGNVLDASEISSLSLDGGSEMHSLFSQRSLLKLAALRDSHRTLSLFTPSISDAVFRAWAGPAERGDSNGASTPATPSLVRSNSALGGTGTTYTFTSRSSDDGHIGLPSRPSLVSVQSATTGLSLGAGRNRPGMRKKKNRIVNLRRSKTTDDISDTTDSDTASLAANSEPLFPDTVSEEPEDNIIIPPTTRTGSGRVRFSSIDLDDASRTIKPSRLRPSILPEQAVFEPVSPIKEEQEISSAPIRKTEEKRPVVIHDTQQRSTRASSSTQPEGPSILEQAWVLKMANELVRHAQTEKIARENFWSGRSSSTVDVEDVPPPAYEAKSQ